MHKSPLRILVEAKAHLASAGWSKTKTHEGLERDSSAADTCLKSAINLVAGPENFCNARWARSMVAAKASVMFKGRMTAGPNGFDITQFNNHPKTTRDDVDAVLDEAIGWAREKWSE